MSGKNNKEKKTKSIRRKIQKYKQANISLINDDKLPNVTDESLAVLATMM